MKGLPADPCLGPRFPRTGSRDQTFKRWHCKVEHGFGFCFLIEHEDDTKKTPVTAGRRQFLFLFCFCLFRFSPVQEEAIVFEEIFSKYL